MNARYRRRSNGKNWVYLGLGGAVAVLIVAIILFAKFKPPPPPYRLKLATERYLKALSDDEIYKAYKMESILGKLPLARYEDAIRKHYHLERRPRYKVINASSASITGNDATVRYKVDVYCEDSERTELMKGEMKFHLQPDGWRKEPEEFLLKAIEAYNRLRE